MKKLAIAGLLALMVFCTSASGYFYMNGETQVLPGEKAAFQVCGWNSGDVAIKVYKADIGSLYEAMASSQANAEAILKEAISDTPVYQTTIRNIQDCKTLELPVLDRGFYVVFGKSSDYNQTAPLIISKLGLVSKSYDTGLMVYSLDLSDGKPISGADLKIYGDIYGGTKAVKSGKTNSEGIYKSDEAITDNAGIIGQYGDDIAVLSTYFYGGWSEKYKAYLYTDRPVYRPNQDVYFKGILWKIENGMFKAAAGTAKVTISDAKGNKVYEQNASISEYGTVSGKFSLADEPPLGSYSIQVTADGIDGGYGSFEVQEYKKPEYEVTLTPAKDQYIRGDTVNIEIDASYYFGSPVADAEVQYTITKNSYYPPCRGRICPYYASEKMMMPIYYGGESEGSGTVRTNGNGKANIAFVPDNDYTANYYIEAKVVDSSRREVTGSTSVLVARGEFDFSVETDQYSYNKGDNVKITIKSRDLNDKPVSAFGKIKIERETWEGPNYDYKKVLSYEGDIETGSDGIATLDFVPDAAGSFTINITGKDSRGNVIESQGYFYASSSEPYWGRWQQLDAMLDKDSYKAGDTAKLTINSPVENFTAFVTVEASEVYKYYIKTFEGTTGTLEMQVIGDYSPNVQVSVLVVKNLTQYSATADLIVPPVDKFITVDIVPGKESYEPGEEAVFTVTTKDSNGNPVPAELSLGIVDESIYAIVQDYTSNITDAFYGSRWSSVSTQMSWQGGSYGPVYDLAESAVGGGGRVMAPSAAPGNGATGAAKAGGFAPARMRSYFPDTAFWHAFVKTGDSGLATVRVTMPDTLTTWRATAKAVTKDYKVGQAQEKVITRKDLLVRLETPRFLTQKDELLISAVVHNYLGKMKDVAVRLEVDGVTLIDPAEKTISVASGGDERVDWRIKADSCCTSKFAVRALTDEESDAMNVSLPIIPYGIKEQDVWAGSLDKDSESVGKTLIVPADSIHGATNLTVFISPSIASTAFDAIDYLASYPYGCVEQTMSSFLPDVYLVQVLKQLGKSSEKLEKELPDMVSQGLQKLYEMQHSDGGWGWWTDDDTHPYMTAYVVYGLTQAKKAGFQVDENVLERGFSSLRTQYSEFKSSTDMGGSKSGKGDANMKAYMAYALSFHETPASYPEDKDLNSYGLALKALARDNRGEAVEFPAKLKANASCDELVCHWSAETFHYSWNNNDVETTAYVLMAMMKTDPGNDMVEKAVRWLVSNRRGNYWYSTKDTATAVFALAEYLKISQELSPDFTASIYLNGKLVESVKKDNAFSSDNGVYIDAEPGTNELKIVKEGKGKLYYSIVLKYFKESTGITAKSSGITVSREYNTTSVKSGEYVKVTLKIDVPENAEYIILEDPLPAGCEVVEETPYAMPYYGYEYGYYPGYWYSNREVRDEKVAYFMTYLYPGEDNTVEYTLRAGVPGTYHAMPATAWNMYDETIRGHSDEQKLQISDKLVVNIGKVVIGKNSVDFTVDSLKLVDGDLSGEIVLQIKDLDGNVKAESREYVSIRESVFKQDMSIPVSLADGTYYIYYTLTTSDGDVISGSKRVQVGEAVVPGKKPVGVPVTGGVKPAGGGDGTMIIIAIVALIALAAGAFWLKSGGRGKKPAAKAKAKTKAAEESAPITKPKAATRKRP